MAEKFPNLVKVITLHIQDSQWIPSSVNKKKLHQGLPR
jgi:hypothetical protein